MRWLPTATVQRTVWQSLPVILISTSNCLLASLRHPTTVPAPPSFSPLKKRLQRPFSRPLPYLHRITSSLHQCMVRSTLLQVTFHMDKLHLPHAPGWLIPSFLIQADRAINLLCRAQWISQCRSPPADHPTTTNHRNKLHVQACA
jgi:hypothetical protein